MWISTEGDSVKKVLILGANGFVGKELCKEAIRKGMQPVGVCRSGRPNINEEWVNQVDWRAIDALQESEENGGPLTDLLMEGGYCGVIHSIGILFDYTTRLKFMNKWLSGSGNVAKSPKDNYHYINYQTAIKAFWATKRAEINNPNIRFGFVSASETRWRNQWFGKRIERLLPSFAKRYLSAKRRAMDEMQSEGGVHIYFPSIVYRWRQITKVPVILGFIISSPFLPFIHKPIHVEKLAKQIMKDMNWETPTPK